MLGINDRRYAILLLCLGYRVDSQCRLSARFRPVDLDHPSARVASDPEGVVQSDRSARDH